MTSADAGARLREVTERIRGRTKDDFGRLVALANDGAAGRAEHLPEVRRIAHRIAGSAGLFGDGDLGDAARQLDDLLAEPSADPAAIRTSLDALIGKLREAFPEG